MAAESFDIELRLINTGLVGPAKQSADALRALEQQMEHTSSAFEDALAGKVKTSFDDTKKSVKGFGDEVTKAMAQAAKLSADPKGFQLLQRARKDLADQKRRLLEEAGVIKPRGPMPPSGGGHGGGFGKGFSDEFGFGKLASAEATGSLIASSIIGAGHVLVEGARKVVDIVSDGFKKAFAEGSKYENLKLGYKLSLRGAEGQDSMEDAGRFSKLTGYDDDVINGMLLPLRRAGFDRKGARSAFAAASDVAAGNGRGGDQGFVQGMLESFTHIKLKGGVQERLLPGMGVDVKLFYADLARTLKTTTDAAKKLAEEGKVNPQLLLNTIYKGIEQRQGGALGTGGIAYGSTMQARLSKLEDLPNQYAKAVAESPKWDAVSEKFGSLLDDLDPDSPRGQKIVDSVLRAFDSLANVVDKAFTAENIDSFVHGLETVVDLAGKLVEQLGPILDLVAKVSGAHEQIQKYSEMGGGDVQKGIGESLTGSADAWSQVKKAYDIGFFKENFALGGGDRNELVEQALREGKINQDQRNSYFGVRGPAAGVGSSVSAPVHVTVQVGAGVDASNAQQVGQAVGDAAGREASKHIGRIAQEAGAR